MTSKLMPSGEVAVMSEDCPAQENAFWTNGLACGQGGLCQSPKSPAEFWLKLMMLVAPALIEK